MEVVDPRMLLEEATEAEKDAQNKRIRQAKIRECLVSLMRIGNACSEESPSKRMNFKDVIIGLMTIKEVFLGVEYGMGGRTSKEGDVYSYGILLLEMLTGKRPTHEFFANGQSLREFCMFAPPEKVMETVDLRMQLEGPSKVENDAQNEKVRQAKIRESLISLVRIGIACSAKSPGQRMNIKDVIIGLTTIKEVLLAVDIHAGRQLRMGLGGKGTS
ncbi:hypothetical protein RHMOL_Rhmol09G0233900 [Rhododendron molle]|uniref:Uncharacterized protein n=1 Tax=Rhododendron molle TaxID=49168 RepID=A0ACC0MGH3_RHOML|nr:hypothetical protein RHMOL_Rhmol09G0233900 [Rhododendron molle]